MMNFLDNQKLDHKFGFIKPLLSAAMIQMQKDWAIDLGAYFTLHGDSEICTDFSSGNFASIKISNSSLRVQIVHFEKHCIKRLIGFGQKSSFTYLALMSILLRCFKSFCQST